MVCTTRILKKLIFTLIAALMTVSLFLSCSQKSTSFSIISRLDEIDALISTGDTSLALSKLKEAEKYSSQSMDFVGIYKRYLSLGEDEEGLKLLEKAMKKYPGQGELLALHVHYLLRHKQTDRAFEEAPALEKTKYASLYSEALFSYALDHNLTADQLFAPTKKEKRALKKGKRLNTEETAPAGQDGKASHYNNVESEFYLDDRFIPFYVYAYNGSKVSEWLINAACLYMRGGQVEKAASLLPETFSRVKDSYFWASLTFDASLYAESLDCLNAARSMWSSDIYSVKSIALMSDDYYILGEDQEAEKARTALFTMQMDDKALKAYDKILPAIYLNSALYSRQNDDVKSQYQRLDFLVNNFPLYEPGLALYCQMALDTLNEEEEEALSKKLREAGLKTQAMERRDALPRVSLEDAVSRVDSALSESSTPSLLVLKENVYSLTHRDDSPGLKQARLWKLLEANEEYAGHYPEEIVKHAVFKLLSLGQEEDAKAMFSEYLLSAYSLTLDDIADFAIPDRFASWEYQVTAWFMKDLNVSRARELYEYIVDRFKQRNARSQKQSQNDALVNALVNLAVIYEGQNLRQNALDSLNQAQGRCLDAKLKALILYRMAKIQKSMDMEAEAIQSLRYALSLDQGNNKARLLLKELTNVY